MKKLLCKDVTPDTDCDFVVTGDTEKEVVSKMMTHIKGEHAEAIHGMSDSELIMMLQANVREQVG